MIYKQDEYTIKHQTKWMNELIKGKIAEEIVEEMFRRVDYTILPFGMEKMLNLLTNHPFRLPRKSEIYEEEWNEETQLYASLQTEEKLRNLPDFLVVKKRKHKKEIEIADGKKTKITTQKTFTAFIEIKFRKWGFDSSEVWNYYNAGTYVVLVQPKPPYFVVGLVLPPVSEKALEDFCEEEEIPEANTFVDLKGNPYFPEFDELDFTPYIEMVKKYLVKDDEGKKE